MDKIRTVSNLWRENMNKIILVLAIALTATNAYGAYKVYKYSGLVNQIKESQKNEVILGHRVGPAGQLMIITK